MAGHVLVLAAALTCLRLGWWQWDVFEAARGTAQNLGYALLWPVFAGSFIYMWLRFLQLEDGRVVPDDAGERSVDTGEINAASEITRDVAAAADDAYDGATGQSSVPVGDAAGEGTPGLGHGELGAPQNRRHTRSSASGREVYTVGMGYIDDDADDPELAAYNRALAALAEQDKRRDR